MSNNITTGKFRASFVNIFKPKTSLNGGDPKYSITMLIPKTDIATLNAINAEIENATIEGISSVFGGQRPARVKNPLYDGDGVRQNGEPFGPECKGHYVMTANANLDYPPEVVDLNGQVILNHTEFYSGCYARASIRFFAYNSNGNKGIGCGLNCVQKLADGEPLTSGISAAAAFANPYVDNAPQTYTPQPQQTYVQPTPQPQQAYNTQMYSTPTMPPMPTQAVNQMSTQAINPAPAQAINPMPTQAINPVTGLPMPTTSGIMGV